MCAWRNSRTHLACQSASHSQQATICVVSLLGAPGEEDMPVLFLKPRTPSQPASRPASPCLTPPFWPAPAPLCVQRNKYRQTHLVSELVLERALLVHDSSCTHTYIHTHTHTQCCQCCQCLSGRAAPGKDWQAGGLYGVERHTHHGSLPCCCCCVAQLASAAATRSDLRSGKRTR